MDVLSSCVGSALTESFRLLFGSIYARIKNVFKIHSNFKDLEKSMESLSDLKKLLDDDELQQHHLPGTQVRDWLKRVEKLQTEFDSVQSTITTNGNTTGASGCVCSLGCRLSNRIVKGLVEVKQLIGDGRAFEDKIVGVNPVPNAVEYIPAPFVEAQPTAKRNLDKIMDLLKRNEKAKKIGVWGMGGAGKTTLVKNVNNELSKDSKKQGFNIVIWVVVSQNATAESIQSKIAERLHLAMNKEESKESAASHLYNKLKGKRFLLILDDIWEGVDLNDVGIPPLEDHDSKVILTTRNFHVCQEMCTDIEFEIGRLSDEEAWKLFSEKVGEEVVNDDQIMGLAKDIVKECDGLPLALISIGASLRKKTEVALWKSALYALQKSEPTYIHGVEEKVYRPLKWSYDSLRGEQLKSCFLFCCLYPEDFEIDIDRLVHYWLAEEKGAVDIDKVKMHDVVRDVGVWIAKSSKDWCKSIISFGISEVQISQQLLSCSDKVKRVSFMYSKITFLPDSSIQCPETTALFLQGNWGLREVPTSFLQGFEMLTTLDLSETKIMMLPDSLLQLGELRALILRNCPLLQELPPLEALRKLQILDCSATSIAKLPVGFETLANLKILLLRDTLKLREIPTGIFCKLHKLEFLVMEYGAMKWGTMNTTEEAIAPFEDLLCLNQLIGDEMVGLLLLNARCVTIKNSEKVDLMLDSLVRNSANLDPFVNLKSLHIKYCCLFGKPSSLGRCVEQTDLLPNLEVLVFMKNGILKISKSIYNHTLKHAVKDAKASGHLNMAKPYSQDDLPLIKYPYLDFFNEQENQEMEYAADPEADDQDLRSHLNARMGSDRTHPAEPPPQDPVNVIHEVPVYPQATGPAMYQYPVHPMGVPDLNYPWWQGTPSIIRPLTSSRRESFHSPHISRSRKPRRIPYTRSSAAHSPSGDRRALTATRQDRPAQLSRPRRKRSRLRIMSPLVGGVLSTGCGDQPEICWGCVRKDVDPLTNL
nr:disease resistance protein At4g27190-like [Ipomoea batatas]